MTVKIYKVPMKSIIGNGYYKGKQKPQNITEGYKRRHKEMARHVHSEKIKYYKDDHFLLYYLQA